MDMLFFPYSYISMQVNGESSFQASKSMASHRCAFVEEPFE